MPVQIRHADPGDYDQIIGVLDEWWGCRRMADMRPRLFFTHFRPTSFVAEVESRIAGFVTGFVSDATPEQAYIRIVGTDPVFRGQGVGQALYKHFFDVATNAGCTEVLAVTSPVNRGSIAFHRSMGFEMAPGVAGEPGVTFSPDYDGPGKGRVRVRRRF